MIDIWIVRLAVLLIILAGIAHGAHQGLLLKLYSLVRIILFLVGTILLGPVVLQVFPRSMEMREAIAYIVTMIGLSVALGVVGNVLHIVDHIPVIGKLNKLGGALLGAVFGVFAAGIGLWILDLLKIRIR